MKIEAAACFLLTGRKGTIKQMTQIVASWDEPRVREEIEKVSERYQSITKKSMSNYFGLTFFVELINTFRNQVPMFNAYNLFIKVAQEKSLYYHNTQYEQDRNSDSELHPESAVNEGKEKEVLRAE